MANVSGTDYIDIGGNQMLQSIEGLAGIDPIQLSYLGLQDNASLSACSVDFICEYLDNGGDAQISNNAPGCNAAQEIIEACNLAVNENLLQDIIVYPNPVSDVFNISVSEMLDFQRASVYSITGKKLLETTAKQIPISALETGVYFIEINTGSGSIVKKIIKK